MAVLIEKLTLSMGHTGANSMGHTGVSRKSSNDFPRETKKNSVGQFLHRCSVMETQKKVR